MYRMRWAKRKSSQEIRNAGNKHTHRMSYSTYSAIEKKKKGGAISTHTKSMAAPSRSFIDQTGAGRHSSGTSSSSAGLGGVAGAGAATGAVFWQTAESSATTTTTTRSVVTTGGGDSRCFGSLEVPEDVPP